VDSSEYVEGHLEVVKWLHANRSEGCSYYALNQAASHGHLEVVKWLHANRTEEHSSQAMCEAAAHGHLHVVKWLYAHRPSHTRFAIDRAVRFGHMRIVCWLQPLFPEYKIGSLLDLHESLVNVGGSRDCGNTFEVLLCLHVCYGYVFTPRFLKTLRADLSRWAWIRNPPLLHFVASWLDAHYPST
jgi:hypothetical protein